jgi:signal transduction histidine kinase
MKLSCLARRTLSIGLLSGFVLLLSFICLCIYLHNPNRGLPYHDSFVAGKADEWKALGGTWELVNGTMRNDSDERGAKLLTGSPYWSNYSIDADIYLLGVSGDAGLIIRSSNEEEGVDSYSGYYAGIRTLDNSLVLGRAEHGWMEAVKKNPAPGGIRPFNWYHLKLLAYDCQIVTAFSSPGLADSIVLGITDQNCIHSGRVSLRSYSSGGIWRNILIQRATQQDLFAILQGAGKPVRSEPKSNSSEDAEFQKPPHFPEQIAVARSAINTPSIGSLRMASFAKPVIATIRGVVVLNAPLLFVQDSTGGVYVPRPKAPLLKVGDEVEVTGEVHPGNFSSTIEHATVQLLWARAPMPPVSVTASQASTGKFDDTFVEVQGRLVSKERGPDNSLILNLDEGPQSFRAIMNPGRSDYRFNKLKLNSRLRLRGICVVDPAFTGNLTSFVLLLRSNEDMEVLAGPPWWNTGHVIAIVIVSLLLALIAVLLYQHVRNWRFHAILEERERLAQEMHDTLAQSFAGIGFQLQAIQNRLPDNLSTLHKELELASNLVRHSHEEARRSIATLRTEDLESEDVLSALDNCARRMVDSNSVQIVLEKEGEQRSIPLRISDTLYHIGQEAIANAVRHAHPTRLTIRLTYGGNSVCLQVEDNGAGFVQGSPLLGFGIRGMRRRAQSISASFQLHSKLGEGTQVRAEAPLPPRITFTSWPRFFWKYGMEHWINARPKKHGNSDPYRR